jgi:hypothetical protein
MEIMCNGVRHIRRRQFHMLHRHTAGIPVAMLIMHFLATEYGHNLHRPRMRAMQDIHTASDKQQQNRKQQ